MEKTVCYAETMNNISIGVMFMEAQKKRYYLVDGIRGLPLST